MLEARGVQMHFGGAKVLAGIDLTIAPNRLLGLIGPNGAGKTTLFNILTGFLRPTGGAILFNGREITGMAPEKRAMLGLARTFQLVKAFEHLSVLENVMVGAFATTSNTRTARTEAFGALERVGLADQAQQRPTTLPLPDRKRMELARCLATRPKMLLLDEVMCGLNPTDMEQMIDLIKSLRAGGMTIVIVEHIIAAIAELADDLVVLASGQILARGEPRAVLNDDAVIEAYLGERFDDAAH
jgi:branched-chain amino acid transport system ATP-binding protein